MFSRYCRTPTSLNVGLQANLSLSVINGIQLMWATILHAEQRTRFPCFWKMNEIYSKLWRFSKKFILVRYSNRKSEIFVKKSSLEMSVQFFISLPDELRHPLSMLHFSTSTSFSFACFTIHSSLKLSSFDQHSLKYERWNLATQNSIPRVEKLYDKIKESASSCFFCIYEMRYFTQKRC